MSLWRLRRDDVTWMMRLKITPKITMDEIWHIEDLIFIVGLLLDLGLHSKHTNTQNPMTSLNRTAAERIIVFTYSTVVDGCAYIVSSSTASRTSCRRQCNGRVWRSTAMRVMTWPLCVWRAFRSRWFIGGASTSSAIEMHRSTKSQQGFCVCVCFIKCTEPRNVLANNANGTRQTTWKKPA